MFSEGSVVLEYRIASDGGVGDDISTPSMVILPITSKLPDIAASPLTSSLLFGLVFPIPTLPEVLIVIFLSISIVGTLFAKVSCPIVKRSDALYSINTALLVLPEDPIINIVLLSLPLICKSPKGSLLPMPIPRSEFLNLECILVPSEKDISLLDITLLLFEVSILIYSTPVFSLL